MASEPIEKGQVIAGRYVVGRRLGEGGMGSVYLVQHVHTDEQLALKILHSTVIKDEIALERFRREARTPARINSDHVVRVTDADVAPDLGGAPFLVMEYLRGDDLEHVVERSGPLPPKDVVLYLRQAARALDKAHSIGIVHRDLKPENLFLTTREDGTPCIKLLDFGIAKLTGAASRGLERASATTTGTIFGTPLYMSPEQAKGESAKISPRTDVWALGLIAHRLLTGRDFWTAETITHLIAQIAYEKMPTPSERGASLGPAYDAWFAGCCAREIDDRYASAGEAVSALASALGLNDLPMTQPSLVGHPGETAFGEVAARTQEITGASPLKMTAGPLTRDPDPAGAKKRAGLVAVVSVAAVGALFAAWALLGGAPAAEPSVATAAATAEPATPAPPASTAPAAAVPVIAVSDGGAAADDAGPTEERDAGAAPAASSASAPAKRPPPSRPVPPAAATAAPSGAPTAKPKPSGTTTDPLSGRL